MRYGKTISGIAATLGLAAGLWLAAPGPLFAQYVSAPPPGARVPPRRIPPRITVVPLSRYHRECDFWLALERRPSGDVFTPQQRCWWALR